MNKRRQIAVAFFSIVIVVVLFLIIYVAQLNANQQVTVWVVKTQVSAGADFSNKSVEPIAIKAADGDFNYTKKAPDGTSQFTVPMAPGDIVRDDDISLKNLDIPVDLTVTGTVAIAPDDIIDVYAQDTSTSGGAAAPGAAGSSPVQRIAHALRCTAVAGNIVTVLIPGRVAPAWVTINADASVKLYLVRATAGNNNVVAFQGSADAISFLISASAAVSAGAAPAQ